MRRSVREALVGFSLVAAAAAGLGLWFWLKGLSLNRGRWTIQATFNDAAGLASRSPVSYRGVQIGTVRSITVNERHVVAELEIDDPNLRLPRPVVARVGAGSLLGGEALVSLISGQPRGPLPGGGPLAAGCDDRVMVCNRGRVPGVAAPSLESVTASVQRLLDQAEREGVVDRMLQATDTFEKTAKETEKLTRQGQAFVGDAQELVKDINDVVHRTDPIVANITAVSADARQTSQAMKRFTASLDDPQVIGDLKATMANARRLSERWDQVGGNIQKLTGDPSFMEGIRSVSMGLGRFFDDLYPADRKPARSAAGAGGPAGSATADGGSPPSGSSDRATSSGPGARPAPAPAAP